ncbi:MAG: hypothetical protein ACW98U_06040 [Candidatus Thorarchaeota archaeon]|jgi:hypothetical protein
MKLNSLVKFRSLGIVLTLLLPAVAIGFQNTTSQSTIWIVYAENQDRSIDVAVQTFADEMLSAGCIVQKTTLDRLDTIPLYSDAIVLVGHGHTDGFESSDSVLPWTLVNKAIKKRIPQITMLIACDSPTELKSNIFGFAGEIDAEAGALLSAWKVKEFLLIDTQSMFSLDRIVEAQMRMSNPLGSHVYFVHGYYGDWEDFGNLVIKLPSITTSYDDFSYFSYFEDYPGVDEHVVH